MTLILEVLGKLEVLAVSKEILEVRNFDFVRINLEVKIF